MTAPEVTIYEKHPHADAYRVGGFYSPYSLVSREKRFTDAELAAEYWRALSSVERVQRKGGTPIRTAKVADSFYRFATLPHYDKDETP